MGTLGLKNSFGYHCPLASLATELGLNNSTMSDTEQHRAGSSVRELRLERERSKLNIEQLTNLVDGGKEWTERRRKMGECMNE